MTITASELCDLLQPKFLFVFTNDITKEEVKGYFADSSPVPERFNLFEVNGLFFPSSGWYTYNVFESTNNEQLNTGLLNRVEVGRLFVFDAMPGNSFIEPNTEVKFKEYGG